MKGKQIDVGHSGQSTPRQAMRFSLWLNPIRYSDNGQLLSWRWYDTASSANKDWNIDKRQYSAHNPFRVDLKAPIFKRHSCVNQQYFRVAIVEKWSLFVRRSLY